MIHQANIQTHKLLIQYKYQYHTPQDLKSIQYRFLIYFFNLHPPVIFKNDIVACEWFKMTNNLCHVFNYIYYNSEIFRDLKIKKKKENTSIDLQTCR